MNPEWDGSMICFTCSVLRIIISTDLHLDILDSVEVAAVAGNASGEKRANTEGDEGPASKRPR